MNERQSHTIATEGTSVLNMEKLINKIVCCTQFITWPILYILFSAFFQLKVGGKENLNKIKTPFILTPNHISFFDSFLLRIVFGFFTPFLPLRFMAVKKFNFFFLNFLYKIGIVPLIYFLFGVFTIVPGAGQQKNLERARKILMNAGNVVIYPEGKINSQKGIGELRGGAVALAQLTGSQIVPITFNIDSKKGFRRMILVNIGEPMVFMPGMSTDAGTFSLFQIMTNLYQKK